MTARSQLYIIGFWMPLGGQKRFGLFKEKVDRGRIRHSYSRPNTEVRGGGEGKLIIGQFYFWRERGRYLLSDSEDIFIRGNKGSASKYKKYLVQRSKE